MVMVLKGPLGDTSRVKVVAYQDSVHSILSFIILQISLLIKIWTSQLWELFHADDFVLISESLDEFLTTLAEREIRFQVNGLMLDEYSQN